MGPFVATLIALPLQALGYATTCTQGDTGSTLIGSVLSLPLLLLVLILLRKQRSSDTIWPIGPLLCALALVTMLSMTKDIWINTLAFGTPCGDGYQLNGPSGGEWWLTLSAYLLLPTVNLALCLSLGVRALMRAAK